MSERDPAPVARVPQTVRAAHMEPLATLPVFFKLGGKRAVVAGGNAAALWKAELLAAAGAIVDVYAAHFDEGFAALVQSPPAGEVRLHARAWQAADLAGAAMAVGALDLEGEASAFVNAAAAAGVPVNIIDQPQFCAFQFGSIVNRSPLVVAISTDGAAPVFGQAIRSRLEALLPAGFRHWAAAAKRWRSTAAVRIGKSMADRRRFWERFSDLAIEQADRVPGEADLEALLAAHGGAAAGNAAPVGFVSLVGAGPGDPELLTLRAVRALRSADVVLYDDLVAAPVLEFARREADRMLVGKTGYGPACKQTEINALMIKLAEAGKRVVRLKSGDPMIFGRGGEEMDSLRAAGIGFDVIPGISAAQAAAAGLPVSLTHRDHAKRLQFITGHSREGRLPDTLDWAALADARATTVVYMAQRTLQELSGRLINAGLPPDTPATAMIGVSRPGERRIAATIATLPAALADAAPAGPCLVLIGEVLRASPA